MEMAEAKMLLEFESNNPDALEGEPYPVKIFVRTLFSVSAKPSKSSPGHFGLQAPP